MSQCSVLNLEAYESEILRINVMMWIHENQISNSIPYSGVELRP